MKKLLESFYSDRHFYFLRPLDRSYEPSYLKRALAWCVGENVWPVEDAPITDADVNCEKLLERRVGSYKATQCSSEPDMWTNEMVYFRRLLFCGFVYCGLQLAFRFKTYFYKGWFVRQLILKHSYARFLALGWIAWNGSQVLFSRDQQRRIY